MNAPWYMSDKVLLADLKVPTIREEITKFSVKYRDKITHQNELASTRRRAQKTEKIQTNRFNNKIFINIISQICKHMIGEYSLECKTCTK